MITLQELVDRHGITRVAETLGMTPLYIERCYRYPGNKRYQIKTVKLVNAAAKLGK